MTLNLFHLNPPSSNVPRLTPLESGRHIKYLEKPYLHYYKVSMLYYLSIRPPSSSLVPVWSMPVLPAVILTMSIASSFL